MMLAVIAAGITFGPLQDRRAAAHRAEVPFPQTTPFSEQETTRLHDIRDAVSKLRGLPANTDMQEGTVASKPLHDWAQQSLDNQDEKNSVDVRVAELAYRLLHEIGPRDDLGALSVEANSDNVAGMYIPTQKSLVLVGGEPDDSLDEEMTLAHEYTHSLQDKAFDITKYQAQVPQGTSSELETTLDCVVEGDATATSIYYMLDKYGQKWLDGLSDTAMADDAQAPSFPPAIERYLYFNYDQCATFVAAIKNAQGWQGVNQLYSRPPVSTEQILHPEKYIQGEKPLDVKAPELKDALGSAWKHQAPQAFGEFDVYNYLLTAGLSEAQASAGADGWGGGDMQVYTKGGDKPSDAVVQISLLWDDTANFNQFRDAFTQAIHDIGYPVIESSSTDLEWSSTTEFGIAVWSKSDNRVDIVLSSDQAALLEAEQALPSASPNSALGR